MRVAVASEGKEVSSKVSEACGRAPFFIIFHDKKFERVVENNFRGQRGGVGISAGEFFVKEKVDFVVAGNFGFKLEAILKEDGINYKEVIGKSVEEALELIDDA